MLIRALKYFIAVAVIASLAPFVLPDGYGGRLFSWSELSWPDPGVSVPGLDGVELPSMGEDQPRTVYKWRDRDGTWHYGDNPPAGVAAEPVKVHRDVNVLPAVEPDPDAKGETDPEAGPGSPIERARDAATNAEQRTRTIDRAIERETGGR
ncbi:DUF4124 domain-containing protein [Ectothiorhodospiraceae bacterium WFHF3C12]|nr:DUF4124 domain-containing protein [Ectothiorhodospiraceae bacterium WFHF3C12]